MEPIPYLPQPGHDNETPRYRTARSTESQWYSNKRWIKVRRYFLSQPDNILCRRCKEQGKYEASRIAHHIIPRLELPESEWYRLDNLEPLCWACHNRHENKVRQQR